MIPSQRSRLGLRSRDISDSNVLDDVQLSSSPSPALPRSSPTSPSVGNSNQQFPLGLLIPNLFKTSLGPTSTQAESTGGSNGASKKSSEAAPSHRGEEEVGAERSERESTTITRSSRTAGVGGKYVPALDTRGAWATEFRSNSAGSGGSGCSPEGRGSTVSTLAGGDCSSGPELASGSRQRETMAVTGVTGKLAITRVREERGGGGVATAGAAVARWWWFTIVVRTAQLVTGLVGVSCCAAFFYGIWDGHYHEHTPDFYLAVGVGQVLLNTALLIYTSTRRPFAPTYARSERLFHGVVPCAYDTITCSLWAACAAFSRVWVQQCNGDVEQLVEGGIEPFDCIRVSVALAAGKCRKWGSLAVVMYQTTMSSDREFDHRRTFRALSRCCGDCGIVRSGCDQTPR
ncbi:hypothetical protein DFJ73DRAFT_815856 [Zopfochytrium polystomum]|nr:hypothetical protein DFJ73DRAFT_815856 [Zopfochytrium polystomum]